MLVRNPKKRAAKKKPAVKPRPIETMKVFCELLNAETISRITGICTSQEGCKEAFRIP